ncbi:hypothetical protein [Streptomyces sp. NPDC059874]|uniref:hypothetical protein n=1 Tax=Streptomyces sp. NPDC059874 TaxID=3346983 RepID=UPI0036477523
MSVYRPDVAVLGAVALVLTAGWVWSGSRPVRVTPAREVDPVPAPPARLPWDRFSRFMIVPWLLGVTVVLPALSVVTELALRPDGDDLKRIAAIQKAGATVAEGSIVAVHRLQKEDPEFPKYSGDVTVEVPVRTRDGGVGTGRVEVVNGHLGHQRDAPSFKPVEVLYAPTAPELGGVVDAGNDVGRYARADSPLAFSLPAFGAVIAIVPGGLLLFVLAPRLTQIPPADTAAQALLSDAAGGAAVPAVRARITAARRGDHTSFGSTDGTVRVTSDHKLRFELEDSEVLLGNPAVEPRGLALLAARMGRRPGWLCGARNWRLIRNDQPVVFVTDEGEVAWLKMDREEFQRILAPAAPVQPDPERRTVLSPAPTAVLPGAHWPWLAGMLLSYGLSSYWRCRCPGVPRWGRPSLPGSWPWQPAWYWRGAGRPSPTGRATGRSTKPATRSWARPETGRFLPSAPRRSPGGNNPQARPGRREEPQVRPPDTSSTDARNPPGTARGPPTSAKKGDQVVGEPGGLSRTVRFAGHAAVTQARARARQLSSTRAAGERPGRVRKGAQPYGLEIDQVAGEADGRHPLFPSFDFGGQRHRPAD